MSTNAIPATLFGLVLAGGESKRMQRDKAALTYHDKPQLDWTYELVSQLCVATFISVRANQQHDSARAKFPAIIDQDGHGPIAGIRAALHAHPKAAWLVVACDLPFVDAATLRFLIEHRDSSAIATAFRSSHDGLPEPLCAIWEPASRTSVDEWIANGRACPRKLLIQSNTRLLSQPDSRALDNINTPDEFTAAQAALSSTAPRRTQTEPHASRRLQVQYFALLREQAGRKEETLHSTAATPAELYAELQRRYPFQLAAQQLKVAVNTEFAAWDRALTEGDTVVFIPPVAGG